MTTNCKFVPVRSARQPEEIQGYVAIWGSPTQRDCFNTYFDKDNPPEMDLKFLPIPLRYGHGEDDSVGKAPIGTINEVWLDEVGIAFRAILDKAHHAYRRIANEIRDGVLATSSGTVDYLAEFSSDGRFVNWPLAEVSLTDRPCERQMPSVAAVRSMPESQHIELAVKPVREAVAIDDPRDCECEEQTDNSRQPATDVSKRNKSMVAKPIRDKQRAGTFPPAKPAVKPAAKTPPADPSVDPEGEPRQGGLTLDMLGLDATATFQDFYQALCGLLGDAPANAYLESMMGPGADEDEIEPMDEESLMRAAPDDPEKDSRPLQTDGDEPEDITDGRSQPDLTVQLRRMLSQQQKQLKPRNAPANRLPAKRDELAELKEQNKLLRQHLLGAPVNDRPTPGADRRGGNGGAPSYDMRDLRYDMCNASELAYSCKLLESVGKQPSDALVRATAFKIAQEIEKSTALGSDMTIQYMSPFRSIADARSLDIRALRNGVNRRAGEVMGDTNMNFGSNYVGVFYDTSLWLKVRAMPIWRQLESRGMEEKVIPVGYASDVIPLEGADFSWYRVPETIDIDATGRPKINIPPSKAGTSSTTISVRTVGALVYYSVLLEEDSIVPMASELNRKAQIEAQEQIEYVIENGDTSTGTGNLNFKNGTVAAGDVPVFTSADGILKAAIVGNSGLNARQAGALSDLDYQLLMGLIGQSNNYITGSDPSKLMFLVDPATGLATDRLPIVKTKDINSAATIENGHVKQMYNVDIFRSGQIFLADSTGYIDSVTAANNKFGRITLVRPDQWVIAFKRQVTMEYFRDAPGQSNGMVITLRMGLQLRDAAQASAASYGVTIK